MVDPNAVLPLLYISGIFQQHPTTISWITVVINYIESLTIHHRDILYGTKVRHSLVGGLNASEKY